MDIVERLSNFDINVSLRFDNWSAFHELKQEVAAEIERLRQFEKDWQAMRDERDTARTGYDNLLDENRGLVKLEAENKRLRDALCQITLFSGQLELLRDGNLQTAVEIARAALSGKTEDDRGEKPIIFSAQMVRAILDGRKTMTRRVLKSVGDMDRVFQMDDGSWHVCDSRGGNMSPVTIPYVVGDRLWVRETWADLTETHGQRWEKFNEKTRLYERGLTPFVWYRADGDQPDVGDGAVNPEPWRSPIHMPRWASRITLTVTGVKVERVQDISEQDARAEGVTRHYEPDGNEVVEWTLVQSFGALWNSIHGPGAWDRNDWVAAISFERGQG